MSGRMLSRRRSKLSVSWRMMDCALFFVVAISAGVLCTMLLLWVVMAPVKACTTIIVGKGASVDGSLMVTHNNDCEDCDVRIGVVPATRNNIDSDCPINPCGFEFPRYVGFDRGSMYFPESLQQEYVSGPPLALTEPIGYIPQVKHTYRYIEGTYGMINQHSLAIGESTCGAKFVSFSRARGGEALLDISALIRLALQRCRTARCAITLMGNLSELHGYAGSEDPVEFGDSLFDVSGEALTVIDVDEAWVFHILPDPTGKSAIWAAQRVHDDHVAVVANKFIIDRMNLSDRDGFMSSKNIVQTAIDSGCLSTPTNADQRHRMEENFNFAAAFSLDYDNISHEGERRRWRVFSLVSPSLVFQPNQSQRFPFSIPVDSKLHLDNLTRLMRDHYEGTPYDSSVGLAAGPYGNPNRFDRNLDLQPEVAEGFFERTISIHRTSYSFVAVVHAERPGAGILWFAHHSPQNSLYLPLFASTFRLPASFSRGNLFRFDRESAWWAFAAVANNADRMYAPIHAVIAAKQVQAERMSQNAVAQILAQIEHIADQNSSPNRFKEVLTDFSVNHNQKV